MERAGTGQPRADAAERRAIVREYVALMRALWQDTEAEFHGDHANLSPSWAWPKPAQRPSVPVLLGCRLTPRGYGEIVGWADGWIGYGSDLDLFAAQVTTLRRSGPRPGGRRRVRSSGRCSASSTTTPCAGASSVSRSLGVDQVVLDLQAVDDDSSPSSTATPRCSPRSRGVRRPRRRLAGQAAVSGSAPSCGGRPGGSTGRPGARRSGESGRRPRPPAPGRPRRPPSR